MSRVTRRSICTGLLLLAAAGLVLVARDPAAGQPAAAPGQEYRIGPKDVLRITVWGHDDLTRSVVVGADGRFQFPLIGDVAVGGLTPAEIEGRLREQLGKDYLVNPQISVSVQEYRSQRVFVLGEVEKAGTYALTGQTTLLDVLSQAGGPAKTAGRQVVVVRVPKSEGPVAPGAAGSVTLRANLKRLLDGDSSENVTLQNGDTVYVPKLTSFFVMGEVLRQGSYTMDKETTALEAVTLAGGFTDRAAPSGGKVLRKRADGTQESIDVDLTSARARDVQLVEGDTLMVPRGNTFFVSGEVRKPGAYQLDKSTTAFGAVTIAGGFTEKAGQSQVKLIRRQPSGEEQTAILDLSGSDPAGRDFPLRDGDTLLVASGNAFYVSGEVRKPGAYQLDKSTTAFGAVTIAGGFTEKAGQSQVKVIRKLPSGQEETVVLDLSGTDPAGRDFPLRDGDTVLVPSGNAFYVLGEVRKPGAYSLEPSTSAVSAITVAGGFTEKAAQSQAKLTRRLANGSEQSTVLDLSGADPRAREFFLKDGDILVIPSGNTFYVLGEVKKPGAYQLDQGTSALQAIAMAGGFTDKAAPNRTKVIRTLPNGRQETIQVDLNDAIKGRRDRDLPLTANDVIVVPESYF